MRRHGAALLAYAAMTVAMTWPLIFNLGGVVAADLGDPLLSIWALWWNASVTPLSEAWWRGSMFYPAPDTVTFSDHRLGIGLVSTPLIWAGVSPVAAYNVVFLVSFIASAGAAYALAYTLTARRGAAFLAGLVYGFNPFRAGHLEHVELLCSYWLPIALLALHKWRSSSRDRWLVLLSIALTMQALTSVYYFAFFAVTIGLWMLWFCRGIPARRLATLALALATPLIAVGPILLRYREAHTAMGLTRTIADIERYSADVLSFITAPPALLLWPSPSSWQRAEGALYPGIVAVMVIFAGWVSTRRSFDTSTPRWRQFRRLLLLGAVLLAILTVAVAFYGPFAINVFGIDVSASRPYKPLSLAVVLTTLWVLTAAMVREAWRTASPFAFYVIATIVLWAFALGPTGHAFGERVLYKAPYAWLMLLPGVDEAFRVPARFAMVAAVTLSAAVALAWVHVLRNRSLSFVRVGTAVVAVAITADSWISPLPLHPTPPLLDAQRVVPNDAVVVELPLGTYEDAAALYRSTTHGRPTVNGLSGYAPPHYQALFAALSENRADALLAIAEFAPLMVFVNRNAAGATLTRAVHALPDARLLEQSATHDVLLVPRHRAVAPPRADSTSMRQVPIVTRASQAASTVQLVADGNHRTGWLASRQQGDEELVADLGANMSVEGIVLAQGAWPGGFPREVLVRTSGDGMTWDDAWRGELCTIAVRTAIENARETTMTLAFSPRAARYVQVRQVGQSREPWAVAEFSALVR